MAPPNAPDLDPYHVLRSVMFYAALVRRWQLTRDEQIARLIGPIVNATKEDSRDSDESFVAELHEDLTALYQDFQRGAPATADERGKELRQLFEAHAIALDDEQLTVLDMTPDEITERSGAADAARTALATVLRISARTISNYRDRLGFVRRTHRTLEDALADTYRPPETRAWLSLQRWRDCLRAARTVHLVLVEFLGADSAAARSVLRPWRIARAIEANRPSTKTDAPPPTAPSVPPKEAP